jgi:hypothetical protein
MCSTDSKTRRRLTTLAALALLAGAAGCDSGMHPVTGRVTFEDGSPLDEGNVVCERQDGGKAVVAQGAVQRDGTFRLGVKKPGEGVPPGKYRVLVVPRALGDAEVGTRPPIIDPKFEKFETSGLELVVKEGPNEFNIKVSKPPPQPPAPDPPDGKPTDPPEGKER